MYRPQSGQLFASSALTSMLRSGQQANDGSDQACYDANRAQDQHDVHKAMVADAVWLELCICADHPGKVKQRKVRGADEH